MIQNAVLQTKDYNHGLQVFWILDMVLISVVLKLYAELFRSNVVLNFVVMENFTFLWQIYFQINVSRSKQYAQFSHKEEAGRL